MINRDTKINPPNFQHVATIVAATTLAVSTFFTGETSSRPAHIPARTCADLLLDRYKHDGADPPKYMRQQDIDGQTITVMYPIPGLKAICTRIIKENGEGQTRLSEAECAYDELHVIRSQADRAADLQTFEEGEIKFLRPLHKTVPDCEIALRFVTGFSE